MSKMIVIDERCDKCDLDFDFWFFRILEQKTKVTIAQWSDLLVVDPPAEPAPQEDAK